jgi:hypothetical protein
VSVKKLFWLLLALMIAGCSSKVAQKANEKAPTGQAPVDTAAIAVIPNPYDDDFTLASKAAEKTKQELIKRGYTVVATEAEAKLIAVPTVETNVATVVKHSDRPIEMFSDTHLSQMDRTNGVANSLGSLGQVSFEGATTSVQTGKDELVIEAFSKDAWDRALIVNELQLQPTWKIRMPLPTDLKPIESEENFAHAAHTGRTADTDFQLPH